MKMYEFQFINGEENKDEYPKLFFLSFSFDGEKYTLTDRPGYMEEPVTDHVAGLFMLFGANLV